MELRVKPRRTVTQQVKFQSLSEKSPQKKCRLFRESLERETGFEPATSTLARSHSTAELLPLILSFYSTSSFHANSLVPHYVPFFRTPLFPVA